MFYTTKTLAESESGLRKIQKNFYKKLWAKNFWDSNFAGPQLFKTQVYTRHVEDFFEIQATLYNIGFSNPVLQKATFSAPLPDLYHPNI